MTRTSIQKANIQKTSLVLAILVLAAVGFTVAAGGAGGAGHRVASFFGHGGHHGCGHPMLSGLMRQLDLNDEQQRHVGAMHNVMGSHRGIFEEAHIALHGALVDAIETGSLDEGDLNVIIDDGLEELRRSAYTMATELSALVNSLDDDQRAILNAHIEAMQATGSGGEGHRSHFGHGGRGHSD